MGNRPHSPLAERRSEARLRCSLAVAGRVVVPLVP